MHDNTLKYCEALQALFGKISDSQAKEILDFGKLINLKAGDFLFKQGENQTLFYVLLSGRLRVISGLKEEVEILGDISEGEPIGEFSLFMEEERMASVFAMRNSILLELSRENFKELVRREPDLAFSMTNFVIDRISRNQFQKQQKAKPQFIAVIPMEKDSEISSVIAEITGRLEETGEEIHHYSNKQYRSEAPDELFAEVEQNKGISFFHCNIENREWTKQCLLYSDLVLLAVPFNSNKSVRQFELDFALYEGGRFKKRVFLLLVHEQDGSLPQGTEKWLEERDIELCLHYRKQHARDTRRIGRILARKAVGLVLGGGGGKGFAHVGAVKALLEAGIEIDFLGGSSAGALYGLNLSYIDFDMERAEKISKESAEAKLTRNDFQFPVVSLMTGKKLKKYLQVVLGDSMLEDFWTNTYCVSTDYSTASAHVIRTGLAWKQIAASIAIPGIYPPVIIDNHLHLDGGLMDNVPIGPMYDYPVGQIISVVLSKHIEKELDIDEIPGSWTLLRDRFLPGKKKYHLPGIASILMNSLILNSHNRLEEYKEDISIYLELDLKGVGMLDDSKWKEMIEKGYVQMKAKLDSITEEDRFWV